MPESGNVASTEALADRPQAAQKVPDFFIVGHHKSGTTALYEMLRSHPDIFMPELKETLFFARELHPGIKPEDPQPDTLAGVPRPVRADQTGPTRRRGVAFVSEIEHGGNAHRRAGAGRAHHRDPPRAGQLPAVDAPGDAQGPHEIERDLRKAIAREQAERETKPVLWYSKERVQYTEQLRRYHAAFGPEQVLILIYDDFRADNEATVRRVLRFLGVDETAPVARSEANQAVLVRSPRLHGFIRSLYLGHGPVARILKPALKALSTQRLRRHGLIHLRDRVIYGKPVAPDDRLMLELRRAFKPEVEALGEYLGRDLVSLWGYDSIPSD